MAENNLGFHEAKEQLETSYAYNVTCNNRFQQLEWLNESEFPRLPDKRKDSINRPAFLSQPIRSNVATLSNNKKRKASSPPANSNIPPPMFPFTFGPSKPIPPNPYRPTYNPPKESLLDTIINWFSEYTKNIENIDDLKQMSRQTLSCELNKLLGPIFSLQQSSSIQK